MLFDCFYKALQGGTHHPTELHHTYDKAYHLSVLLFFFRISIGKLCADSLILLIFRLNVVFFILIRYFSGILKIFLVLANKFMS